MRARARAHARTHAHTHAFAVLGAGATPRVEQEGGNETPGRKSVDEVGKAETAASGQRQPRRVASSPSA
eukprot:13394258-Alexandrium_andersonii.AAC.1